LTDILVKDPFTIVSGMVIQLNQWSKLDRLISVVWLLLIKEFTELFSNLLNFRIIIILLNLLAIILLVHAMDADIVVLHPQPFPGDVSPDEGLGLDQQSNLPSRVSLAQLLVIQGFNVSGGVHGG